MERDDAAGETVGPRFFNLEPDGFAVIGGLNAAVEYVDPAVRRLLPELQGDLVTSPSETGRRVCDVFHQVLDTGVAALVRGLPATNGGSVDLMLKRVDADGGRRVLALARVREPEPEHVSAWLDGEPESPDEAKYIPIAVPASSVAAAAAAGARFQRVGPLQPDTEHAAGPVQRAPTATISGGGFDATLARIGLSLQAADDLEAGLEAALRDASVALGCSTASLMLRRNRTSVVAVTYGMPAEYQGHPPER